MAQIIVFDIDRTLYNTDKFHDIYTEKFTKDLDISPEKLSDSVSAYKRSLKKSTDFLPKHFLRFLSRSLNISLNQLEKYYLSPDNFTHSIYPDVIPALKKLSKHCSLGVFSEGYISFQKLKISSIRNYFNPGLIFILRRKTFPVNIRKIPSGSTVVDDNPEIINQLTKYPNLHPVWLNRKDDSSHPSAPTIHSLIDLPSINPFPSE